MTDVGRTALSVEIRTKACAPNSPASVATRRVARMLFLIASEGFDSIMGTCLCAAACTTTWGRYFAKMDRIRISSPQSATSASTGVLRKLRSDRMRSCSMSNRANSARSTRRMRAGRNRATCRASSEPIEPPAPVTMTVLPSRNSFTDSRSSTTGLRPSRSSTLTSRIRLTFTRPSSTSEMPGAMRTLTGTFWQSSISRRISARLICAIVMTTCSMPRARTICPRSRVVPRTGSPCRTIPCLEASSSRKPWTSSSVSSRPSISRAAARPNSPAPTKRVGTRGPSFPRGLGRCRSEAS